jgi:hypothetical protein
MPPLDLKIVSPETGQIDGVYLEFEKQLVPIWELKRGNDMRKTLIHCKKETRI